MFIFYSAFDSLKAWNRTATSSTEPRAIEYPNPKIFPMLSAGINYRYLSRTSKTLEKCLNAFANQIVKTSQSIIVTANKEWALILRLSRTCIGLLNKQFARPDFRTFVKSLIEQEENSVANLFLLPLKNICAVQQLVFNR
uniref:Uncharacterized protein n=1 Tax=Romanomermis culicivorax TaxID=13658 RepID=A0A915HWQ9_ROMCU